MADEIGFLVVLRAVACLLVVYCHLIAYEAPKWFLVPAINRFVTDPLHILWYYGFLGVAVFFVISGFIITHVAQREARAAFAIKRFFRIYPPFLAVLATVVIAAHIFHRPEADVSPTDLLWEASIFGSGYLVVGVSWTLTIELTFYALAAAILPLMRSRPMIATLVVAILPAVVHLALRATVAKLQVEQISLLFFYQNYVSVFAIGMAIYYGWSRRLAIPTAVALAGMAWAAFVWTTGPGSGSDQTQVNVFYAIVIFLGVLWANPKPSPHGVVAAVARGSYSLYLLHDPIGALVIYGLRPLIGFSAAIVICAVVLTVGTWLSYRYFEKPSQAAGRALIKKWSTMRSPGVKVGA